MVAQSDKKEGLNRVKNLVQRFKEHESDYQERYTEEDTKDKFINPFFEALGWDVHNENEKAPYEEEVLFERMQKTKQGNQKFPDYTFYINGELRFFVEAKKPSINLSSKGNELIGYVKDINSKVAILTNFKSLKIYDTRGLHENRFQEVRNYNYTDYVEKWDEIYDFFSKDEKNPNKHLNVLPDSKELRGVPIVDNEDIDKKEIEYTEEDLSQIIEKIKENKILLEKMDEFSDKRGSVTGRNDLFRIEKSDMEKLIEDDEDSNIIQPLLESKYLYKKTFPEKYIITVEKDINVKDEYPQIFNFLKSRVEDPKDQKKMENGFHFNEYAKNLNKPKIIYPYVGNDFKNYFDSDGKYYLINYTYFISRDDNNNFYLKILNAILSSNLMRFYLKEIAKPRSNTDKRLVFSKAMKKLPVIDINEDDVSLYKLNSIIEDLSQKKDDIKKLEDIKNNQDLDEKGDIEDNLDYFNERIKDLENDINKEIYELYGINDEEIKIIEDRIHNYHR